MPLPFVRPSTPLKDRFNYLTSDVGAKVLATSDGIKNANQILNRDRDSYMMAEREIKKKWVTLALIEDILLDTIVIGNFEYYSSTPKKLQVLGSLTYPCQQWALLGEFEANDTRAEQVFELRQPMWARCAAFSVACRAVRSAA